MTPNEQAEAVLAEGGSEAQAAYQRSIPTYTNPLMTHAGDTCEEPIVILSTQTSGTTTDPIRIPISHLVPDHRCNAIPRLV